MLGDARTFGSFSIDDMQRAKTFYGETLGLDVSEENGLLTLHHPGGAETIIYPRPDHAPATFTVLNFLVDDIEATVRRLTERNVPFEHYPELGTDESGISRGRGPSIAWFRDPAGNILSIIENR